MLKGLSIFSSSSSSVGLTENTSVIYTAFLQLTVSVKTIESKEILYPKIESNSSLIIDPVKFAYF